MLNRRPSKHRVFHASKENTTMSKVRQHASCAKQTPIP
jgi:cell envelope opacity-associated protein A